jgi:ribosome-binding factor A
VNLANPAFFHNIPSKNVFLHFMSVRQEKFAGLIQQHLAEIFQRNSEYVNREFVTISKVEISPDLGYAKIYISLIKKEGREALMKCINLHNPMIRKQLAIKVRNQARIVPELNFFIDESLDYVFHMDEVMKRINEEDERKRNENN